MSFSLGIIGAGGIAALHAEAAAAAGLRVAGIYDVLPERAEALAAPYPGAVVAESVEALLGRTEIAAVAVATPNAFHKEHAISALRAGKDVLLEKPMAMTTAECDEII